MTSTLTLAAIAATVFSLSACTNMDGTMNQPANGALIGGVTGAALGNALGGTRTSTLIGAVAGAAVGDAIGTQMASQKAELDKSLAGTGAQVVTNGTMIEVILPENVTFPTGSDVVNASFKASLNAISQNLQMHSRSTVQVVGHTDNVGTQAFNDDLSRRRALSVSRILIGDGLASARLTYTGKGESQPIASNNTVEGRAANRRVEIFITPTR